MFENIFRLLGGYLDLKLIYFRSLACLMNVRVVGISYLKHYWSVLDTLSRKG